MGKPDAKGRKSTAFRIPEVLLERLDIECDQRCVGRNLMVTRAIEDFLDRLPSIE